MTVRIQDERGVQKPTGGKNFFDGATAAFLPPGTAIDVRYGTTNTGTLPFSKTSDV